MKTIKKIKRSARAGFTLIELLVVTAIIVIISTVILANNSKFGGRVLLENFAYDLALTLRQTQVYGIAVSRFGTNTFTAGYGMHFDITSSNNAKQYTLFADATTANGLYDAPSELVSTFLITRGYSITKLCATPTAGTENCTYTTLDVLFQRPEPDAMISPGGASCIITNSNCQASARIQLVSPRGDTMSVTVQANGQIAVQTS